MGWGLTTRLARVAVSVGVLLSAGILSAAAHSDSASETRNAATEAQCAAWLGEPLQAELAGRGYEFQPLNSSPLARDVECWWADPISPRISYFAFGFAEQTREQALVEAEALLATGDWARDAGDPGVVRADQQDAPDQASLLDPSWRYGFADGYWIFVVDSEAPERAGGEALVDEWTDEIARTVLANLIPEPAPEPEPEAAPEPEPQPTAAPEPGGGEFTAETPSTLRGLRTVAEVDLTPLGLGGCLAVAVVLTALVGLPGRLVDSALMARYEDWSRFLAPWQRARERWARRVARVPRGILIGAGLVAAAGFASLIEPDLGWNGGSARLVLSLLAAMVLENLVGLALIVWWLARRGHAARLQLKLGSLLVVLISALISRWVGFEPGFVFGLVLVIVVLVVSHEAEAEHSLAEMVWLLVLGVVGWAGYSLAVAVALDAGGVAGLFVTETLSGLAVGCLSALPLLALPLRGMPGAVLWSWRRPVWAAVQAGSMAMFVFVVLPLPGSWDSVDAPFSLWVGLFALYAAGAVLAWLVLRFVPIPAREAQHADDASR